MQISAVKFKATCLKLIDQVAGIDPTRERRDQRARHIACGLAMAGVRSGKERQRTCLGKAPGDVAVHFGQRPSCGRRMEVEAHDADMVRLLFLRQQAA